MKKTTLCLNLAFAFAQLGRKTLLIDTDPQGGIGHSLSGKAKDAVGLVDLGEAILHVVEVATPWGRFGIGS